MKGEPLYEGAVCAIKGAVFERGKLVITTDGAPAWGDGNDYGGRLVYLKGFKGAIDKDRVEMLKRTIVGLCCQ